MLEKKDYKLLISLLLWFLIPSVYTLVRMNIISINKVDIDILGQMEWFDLLDEILVTMLTVPLYSLLKKDKFRKNNVGLLFVISFTIYSLFTIIISNYVAGISAFMNAEYAAGFLKLQAFSLLIAFIGNFSIIVLTVKDSFKLIICITVLKFLILSVSDYFFIKRLNDLGAAYSEIVANSIIAVVFMTILFLKKYISFKSAFTDISILKKYFKVGFFSGVQIFLDNFIYAVMICKMVNAVSESGNYWVANNFIWGWLLVPVICVAEIIKKNSFEKIKFKNFWVPGIVIVGLWIITSPFWKIFIDKAMAVNSNTILRIVKPLIIFYIAYIVAAFIDAWFISKGKTIYNAINSLIINVGYYGIAYILFKQNIFTLDIYFIINLFGFGMVVHMLFSILFYKWDIKKQCLR